MYSTQYIVYIWTQHVINISCKCPISYHQARAVSSRVGKLKLASRFYPRQIDTTCKVVVLHNKQRPTSNEYSSDNQETATQTRQYTVWMLYIECDSRIPLRVHEGTCYRVSSLMCKLSIASDLLVSINDDDRSFAPSHPLKLMRRWDARSGSHNVFTDLIIEHDR